MKDSLNYPYVAVLDEKEKAYVVQGNNGVIYAKSLDQTEKSLENMQHICDNLNIVDYLATAMDAAKGEMEDNGLEESDAYAQLDEALTNAKALL